MRQVRQIAVVDDAGMASLVFRAGALLCALRLDEVVETMRPLATRPLAGTPAFVRGISVLRGVPTPVIDVARLLVGGPGEVNAGEVNAAEVEAAAGAERYIAVRTERGPVALATGEILGVRVIEAEPSGGHPALLGANSRFVAGVGVVGTEPLLLLQSMRAVPDEVWEAAAAAGVP